MKRLIKSLTFVFGWLVLMGGCQGKEVAPVEYTYHRPQSDIRLSYKPVQQPKGEGGSKTGNLETLFDGDAKTGIDLSNVDGTVVVNLSKPVYVKEYDFTFRIHRNAKSRPLSFVFSTAQDEAYGEDADFLKFPLGDTETTLAIRGDGNYFGFLKTQYAEFGLTDPFMDTTDPQNPIPAGAVELTEVRVIYSNKPIFTPTLTLPEIEVKYVKGRKVWRFDGFKDGPVTKADTLLENTIMKHLMFWGLTGDRTAEQTFLDYSPNGDGSGEGHSGLVSLYEATRQENQRLTK